MIIIGLFSIQSVKAQTLINNLPTIFSINKQLADSAVTLRVGLDYDTKIKGVRYYEKEKGYGNIDTLLCKYEDLLYLDVHDNEFDVNLLKCFKDSLKYLNMHTSTTLEIDFQLLNLEEIIGDYDMQFLASLLKNSPKFTASEFRVEGQIELLENIEFNSLRYFWMDSRENCFCRKNLSFPASLFNAPNLEILYLPHYCKKYFFSRDKYFAMPEITSDSSKITNLTIYKADLSDENTLKQIKKLKNLEYLDIGFTGTDYSNLEQLQHIKQIVLVVPRKYWKKGIMTVEISEGINRKYPNVGIL